MVMTMSGFLQNSCRFSNKNNDDDDDNDDDDGRICAKYFQRRTMTIMMTMSGSVQMVVRGGLFALGGEVEEVASKLLMNGDEDDGDDGDGGDGGAGIFFWQHQELSNLEHITLGTLPRGPFFRFSKISNLTPPGQFLTFF